MTRNLKALGLALVAAFAMSAVAASAASAVEFHSEGPGTIVSGEQTNVNIFTVDTGEAECEKAKFKSALIGPKTVTSITVAPSYENCVFAGLEAEVTMNNCAFILYSGELQGGNYEGTADIECPSGQYIEMEMVFSLCVVYVPPQKGLSNVTYTNEGVGQYRTVMVDANVTGIEYEEKGKFCSNPNEATANGKYTGSITVAGDQGGIWVE